MDTITITTLTSSGDCDDSPVCPSVHRVAEHPDTYFVILTHVHDPHVLAAFAPYLGPGEVLGTAPCAVIDGVGGGR